MGVPDAAPMDDAARLVGIIASPTAGLLTTEQGGQASFTVRLASKPSAPVVMAVTSSNPAEGTVSPAQLTFTPENWNSPHPVIITGVDDQKMDGDVAYEITLGPAVSSDSAWNGLLGSEVSVTNVESATAGLVVASTLTMTSEARTSATFTVALRSQPSAAVAVAVTSSDTTEGVVSPAQLTFTTTNWKVPQTVTVTGVDDAEVDGRVAYDVVVGPVTSSDATYAAVAATRLSFANLDDDSPSIAAVAASRLITSENGGKATFALALTARPTADVTITLDSDDASEGVVAPRTVVFTPQNWQIPVTITVTGVDDMLIDGPQKYNVTFAAASADPAYDKMKVAALAVTNSDDEVPGIRLGGSTNAATTEAGGTATFTVVLTAPPTANVTIGLSSSDTTEGTASPASLTFTPANWATAQTVTATGVNDDEADGDQTYAIVTAPAVSTDPAYQGMDGADRPITNVDDDSAGFVIEPLTERTVTEAGGEATFTVRLSSAPKADVSLGLTSSNTAEGTVSPASLTFTAANWATAQTVTIKGVDDAVVDGDRHISIVTSSAISTDMTYAGVNPADVPVVNTDDDIASIVVSAVNGIPTEAGGFATFTVKLGSQPSASVTIPISSSNTNEGTVNVSSLTFTTTSWSTPQTVTIKGVDDAFDDDGPVYAIVIGAASSADPSFDKLDPVDLSVRTSDNDAAGITVTPTSGLLTSETGGTATFTVVLTSRPASDVVIGVTSSDLTEGTVSPAMLTFNAANWTTPQTVTITGQSDLLSDGDVGYSIVLATPITTDAKYAAINPTDPTVTNREPGWSTFVDTGADAAYTFEAADINGDTRLDLVTSPGSSSMKYYTQNMDGTFTLAQTISATNDVYGIAIGDINQDMSLDILTAGPNGALTSSNEMFLNGMGTFAAGITTNTSNSYFFYGQQAALADVTGDNKVEGLWATTDRLMVGRSAWASNAWSSFDSIWDPVSGDAKALVLADVDSDGDLDAVVARGAFSLTWDGGISIFKNDGTGWLGDQQQIDASTDVIFDHSNPYGLAIADFNEDGKPDLAFSNYSSGLDKLVVALRTSANGASPTYSFTGITDGAGELYGTVVARDVDGDGHVDLVVGQNTGRVLTGNGMGGFTQTKTFGAQGYPVVADFDGDGHLDIAFISGGTVRISYWR